MNHMTTSKNRLQFARFNRSGTTTVEMAVLLPVIFLLIVGSIQLFRYYTIANSVELAVMEGARRGLLPNADESDAVAAAQNYLRNVGIYDTEIEVERTNNDDGHMEVYISAELSMSKNGFLVLTCDSSTIRRECRIRCESAN
jgi:Flp pilus assembly protein TadG